MADPKRVDLPATSEAAERDSRAEALLVEGLDRYFEGQYQDAIHIWTRVLFLDRAHQRARAYIDRARSALAERQRRAEEMLQAGHDLLDQGRTGAARHLLTEAVATSGDDERASALRRRLERLELFERAHATASARVTPGRSSAPTDDAWPRRRVMRLVAIVAVAALVIAGMVNPAVQNWLGIGSPGEQLTTAAPPARGPVLTTSDVALIRARNFYNRGRLAEALKALDRVRVDSPVATEADELRVQIQQVLLAGATPGSAGRPVPR
jgi:tetratricopeptide (TPR) repeat protein